MSPQNTFHLKLAYVEHTSEQCQSDVQINFGPQMKEEIPPVIWIVWKPISTS